MQPEINTSIATEICPKTAQEFPKEGGPLSTSGKMTDGFERQDGPHAFWGPQSFPMDFQKLSERYQPGPGVS